MTCFAQAPSLSNVTCQEFWDEFNKQVQASIGGPAPPIMNEMKNLGDYESAEFKKAYPDLAGSFLKELNQSGYFVMFIYTACEMKPENMPKKVHEQMQKNLYRLAIRKKQEATAEKNGCALLGETLISEFGLPSDQMIAACVEENFSSGKITVVKDDAGKPTATKVCTFPDGPNGPENCQVVEPSKENVCLAAFGVCKEIDGKCGWMQTDESQSCIAGKKVAP